MLLSFFIMCLNSTWSTCLKSSKLWLSRHIILCWLSNYLLQNTGWSNIRHFYTETIYESLLKFKRPQIIKGINKIVIMEVHEHILPCKTGIIYKTSASCITQGGQNGEHWLRFTWVLSVGHNTVFQNASIWYSNEYMYIITAVLVLLMSALYSKCL